MRVALPVVAFLWLLLDVCSLIPQTRVLRRYNAGTTRLQSEMKEGGNKFGLGKIGKAGKSHDKGHASSSPGATHQAGSSASTVGNGAEPHGVHHHTDSDNMGEDAEHARPTSNSHGSGTRRSTPVVSGLGLGQSFDVVSKLPSTANPISSKSLSLSTRPKTQEEQLKDAQDTIDMVLRKVEKLEKALAASDGRSKDIITYPTKRAKAESELDDFMNSLKMKQIALSPQNVERCSMMVFFILGGIIGTSIFHRLWLLGGLIGSWWASDAVNRDTKYGLIARRTGVRVAQFIRDLQERWNYLVIYYETGRLAYASQKRWEKIDKRFKIDERFQEFKKIAMNRATQLNSQVGVKETLGDIWEATKSVGAKAAKIDDKYGVTENVRDFSKGLYLIAGSRVGSWLDDVRQVGSSGAAASSSSSSSSLSSSLRPYSPTYTVNPWSAPWMPHFGDGAGGGFTEAQRVREQRERERQRNVELAALRRKRERDRIQRNRARGASRQAGGPSSFYNGFYQRSNGNGRGGGGGGFWGGLFGR